MSIIEKKQVNFNTALIDGVDAIKYIDTLYQSPFFPFEIDWEVYEVTAYYNGEEVFDLLPAEAQDMVWSLAQMHSATANDHSL